jgi:hypothetical protein
MSLRGLKSDLVELLRNGKKDYENITALQLGVS